MNIILAIQPQYWRLIACGMKTWEFRKHIPSQAFHKIIAYSAKRLVGWFIPGEIVHMSPQEIWERCNKTGGIDRARFDAYFLHKTHGYAIAITSMHLLPGIDPLQVHPNFHPPQSFCYTSYNP